jgi:formylglycine-generating enzyme required for sulfatase activity
MREFDLSQLIEQPGSDAVVLVPAGEHRCNLVIRRAMTIRGRGAASHLQGAPGTSATISILAPGVVLEDLALEHLDGVALFCGRGIQPEVHNVSIRGRIEFAGGDAIDASASGPPGPPSADSAEVMRLFAQAEALEGFGKPDEAARIYDQILELAPNHLVAIRLKNAAARHAKSGVSMAAPPGPRSPASAPAPAAVKAVTGPVASAPQVSRVSVVSSGSPGFVLVPAGTFTMGSPEDEDYRSSNESQCEVTITRPLLVAAHLTTQDAFMGAMGRNPSDKKSPNLPVYGVTWWDAVEYANKVSEREGLELCYDIEGRFLGLDRKGYRLPTSAEWEYFARAGVAGARYGALDDICWYRENSGYGPNPVGTKLPNAWGLYDVLGNVEQWTNDRSKAQFIATGPRGGVDPIGDTGGDYRVTRGASFMSDRKDLRFAGVCARAAMPGPFSREVSYWYGLRLVRVAA